MEMETLNYNIYFDVLTEKEIQLVREWRNFASRYGVYRTPFLLTEAMQLDFFNNTVNDRTSNSRYWGIHLRNNCKEGESGFIGIAGLNNIQWENGIAEIALTISIDAKGKGYGEESLNLIAYEAFCNLRLYTIYGECYLCNPNRGFWENMIEKYRGYRVILQDRKYYNGSYFDSIYFSFNDLCGANKIYGKVHEGISYETEKTEK